MENHNKRIKFHLNDKELNRLARDAKRLGLSRSAYVRHLVSTIHPKPQPKVSDEEYLPVLQKISTEFEQISEKAQKQNAIDDAAYRKAVVKLETCLKKLLDALHQPPEEGGSAI